MTVDLGFLEKSESWRLESRFFPSKVGGRPAWLDLKNIPKKEDLECDYCKNPCIFLCQIYAPFNDNLDAFHRTLYVFVCKNPGCCKTNKSGNLKVLRSQLSKCNSFYPSEPPIEEENWRADINANAWCKTCHVCEIAAPNHCSKCKIVNYCCRDHQVYDWKQGHKNTCGSSMNKNNNFLFPEYELIIEPEKIINEDNEDCDEVEETEIEKYMSMVQRKELDVFQTEEDIEDLSKMAAADEDEVFTQFRTRIEKYPDQVIRYENGGQILYISNSTKIEDIPKCSICGTERQFEFQIMPQLLNFLDFKDVINSLDWGIVAIFTCKNSCMPKNGYIMEYIWKQDIVTDKIDN